MASGTRLQTITAIATILGVVLTLFISGASLYYSYQANSIATQANSIAFSAYSVVNNYPPYIDVSSNSVLVLRPVNCRQINDTYVDCELGGTFSINVTMIAAHSGYFDVSGGLYGIGPFSQKASYSFGAGPPSVHVGNATITLSTPLGLVGAVHEIVQGGQRIEETLQVQLVGLDVKMPSSSLRGQTVSGSCAVAVVLTYVDIQAQASYPRTFTVQAQIELP